MSTKSEIAVASGTTRSADELSGKEYLLYSLLFLVIPWVCVIVSSVLYYAWRKEQPRRAGQINVLGFIIFGIDLVVSAAYYALSAQS